MVKLENSTKPPNSNMQNDNKTRLVWTWFGWIFHGVLKNSHNGWYNQLLRAALTDEYTVQSEERGTEEALKLNADASSKKIKNK